MFNFQKKSFTVTIGDEGVIVALHTPEVVKTKLLITSFDDDSKVELRKLFKSNKSAPIYIILDTVDQNYRKKDYPHVNRFDLARLIRKDLIHETSGDSKTIKNYLTTKDVETQQWKCTFIYTPRSAELDSWNDFLLEMPNKIMGIYMLPVEVSNLLKKISKPKNKKEITFFIIQNKLIGTRQVVFSGYDIVFTRVINYDFKDKKFTEEYEQDIFRTNEYLKRVFPEIQMKDVEIINIMPEKVIKRIQTIKNKELNFVNYTPYEAAAKIGYKKSISQKSNFADTLCSHDFARSKNKILKFVTPRIGTLKQLYISISSLLTINTILLFVALGFLGNLYIATSPEYQSKVLDIKKKDVEKKFSEAKNSVLGEDVESSQINEIIYFGKINEILDNKEQTVEEIFKTLKIIKNHGSLANSFSFNISNYDPKNNTASQNFTIAIAGNVTTASGDVEELFKQFDGLVLEVKKSFEPHTITASELPRNIDFSKKYYKFPFDIKINGKN